MMLIYVDIDETICSFTDGEYDKAKPIEKNIKKINDLHGQGHTIVYWTARGTKTGKMWYHLTTEQLKQWGCRYDELRLGKPAYDVLICDKTINLSNKKLL